VESLSPPLDAVSAEVLARVRERLATGTGLSTPAEVEAAVRECGTVLGSRALAEVVRAVRADVWGAGPLQHLVEDPEVTDVLVNGPRDVWVDRGAGLSLCPLDLGDVGRFASWRYDSPPSAGSAWTTRARSRMVGSPTAPGCMRCCHRSQGTAP